MAAEPATIESTATLLVSETPPGDKSGTAVVVRFYVVPGDRLEAGAAVCLLRTDRFLYDLPAPAAGIVEELLVEPDEQFEIGIPLLRITPPPPEHEPAPPQPERPPLRVTPLARAIAAAHGYDILRLEGSSVDGRIRAADVQAAVGEPVPSRQAAAASSAPAAPPAPAQIRPWAPPFLFNRDDRPDALTAVEVDCGADAVEPDNAILIVYALIQALVEHPWLNSRWTGEGVLVYGRINLRIWRDTGGNLHPTMIVNAGDLSPRGIVRALQAIDAGHVPGTATATFDVLLSRAAWWSGLIAPPGAATLLHVGAAERRVVVEPRIERLAIRARRLLVLSYDARHIAQPEADSLLRDIRARAERRFRPCKIEGT